MAPPRHKQPCWLKGFSVLFKLKRFTDQGFFVHFCPDFFLIVSIQPSLPDSNSKETFLNFKTLKSLEIWEILFKLTKHSYTVFPRIITQKLHCCIKCPQNLQLKTLLQTYTAFTWRNYNKILLKVFDPRYRGNLLLIL